MTSVLHTHLEGNSPVELTHRTFGPDHSKVIVSPNGQRLIGSKTVEKKMVIECDGHEFHERTKEQARRDRERDRFLQSIGYLVFRYTGAEIWADVFERADEAVKVLYDATNKEFG